MRTFLAPFFFLGCQLGAEPASESGLPAGKSNGGTDAQCEPLPLDPENLSYFSMGGDFFDLNHPQLERFPAGIARPCHSSQLLSALSDERLCPIAHVVLLRKASYLPAEVRALKERGAMGWGIDVDPSGETYSCESMLDYRELWGNVDVMPDRVRMAWGWLRRSRGRGRPRR